ncbi:hypothetical protein [Pontibacillus sp. HMF3514]|uniref:hypothetical protein n=1 Tax=Pontibacillus sp. HMF3514 TaxID=2692425 RepID=UPI0013204056|nr:hypothetical protein [Pontibacillus sp. HMF3514]QHE51760.1 hypothetical protein GS400_06790 [Pontibacillus sp. HMF3514]
MNKQIIKITACALLLICMVTGVSNLAHAEEGRLQIKVDEGLNGKAKRNKGFPITLTVTNNGEDFSGDLTVVIPRDYNSIGNKVIPIDIAAGATKKIHFSVPQMEGMNVFRNGLGQPSVEQFHLYEGNWEDGKKVPVDTGLSISPTYIQDNKAVIGVLTDQPDQLNYLKLLSFMGESPEILFLDAEDIPKDSTGLHVLDVLVIQDYDIANLSENRQKAIKQWMQKGGHIATGSTPGLMQQYGILSEDLPFQIEGKKSVNSIERFNQIEQFDITNFELYKGTAGKAATIKYEENGSPLVIQQNQGQGKITQFTYDISHPAFQEWGGNEDIWDSVVGNYQPNHNMNLYDRLGDTSRYFETLANFKLSTLAFLFLGYILLVVPILYFILKKIDKREWAWLVIPALAVITSVGLYVVGAQDRLGDYKTKAVSIVSVDQNGEGYGKGSVSMLSKESGTYTLEVDASLESFPTNTRRSTNMRAEDIPYIETGSDNSRVYFEDVEFWSPRSVTVNLPFKEYGHFSNTINFDDKHLTGEITNNFPYSFEDVYIVGGQSYQEIGSIQAGESKSLDINMQTQLLFQAPDERTAYQMFNRPTNNLNQNEQNVRRDLVQMAARYGMFADQNNPVLIGFTKDKIYDANVNGKETSQDNLHLVTQAVNINLGSGNKSVSTELRNPTLTTVEGQVRYNGLTRGDLMFDANQGTYLLKYNLPEAFTKQGFEVNKLSLDFQQRPGGVSFAIYNAKVDAYDSIEDASFDQNVQETYIEENTITIRATVPSNNMKGPIFVPSINVKGVTNP